jgi:hypothetical protein
MWPSRNEVHFRDGSEPIIRKAREDESSKSERAITTSSMVVQAPLSLFAYRSIPTTLTLPVHELGAQDFFSRFTYNKSAFTNDYREWLAKADSDCCLDSTLLQCS